MFQKFLSSELAPLKGYQYNYDGNLAFGVHRNKKYLVEITHFKIFDKVDEHFF